MSCRSFGSCLMLCTYLFEYITVLTRISINIFVQVSILMFLFVIFFKDFGLKPVFERGAKLEMFRKQHEESTFHFFLP